MLREAVLKKNFGADNDFLWRGNEVTRIEAFSDAVFAFAITLIVVSLEVPKTFSQLADTMRGFVSFGISFTFLVWIWYQHYKFFRRYGLQDTTTIVLNAILLFVVLFYIYPLKFLFTMLVGAVMGTLQSPVIDGIPRSVIEAGQATSLMVIYGLGFMCVFLLFALLHVRAYRKRETLELNLVEIFHTQSAIHSYIILMAVSMVSILITVIGGDRYAALSGMTYGLIGPALGIYNSIRGKKRRKLESA